MSSKSLLISRHACELEGTKRVQYQKKYNRVTLGLDNMVKMCQCIIMFHLIHHNCELNNGGLHK